ncbi:uncharacterized protein LOC108036135 [Drosophila biarmipes]|uniref:uncharacterized protein LOC108036135 n=1 Tax=Drosophila biarmipes TaxID=125945 RepID=UPI0007E88C32|nr:uncharacterized protein LOC108036135 [Drosophila biarmipes]
MKGALVCICLALFMALYGAEYVCNPNGNNQPDCSNASNLNVPIRNFWDPTRYWQCNSTTGSAAVVICPNSTGFDPTSKECVSWGNWTWTPYCP